MIECPNIGQQQALFKLRTLFLKRAVKAFIERIHLQAFGIRVAVADTLLLQVAIKRAAELGAVVGEHLLYLAGKNLHHQLHKELGVDTVTTKDADSKTKPAMQIYGGEQIAAMTLNKPLHGIHGNAMSGMHSIETLVKTLLALALRCALPTRGRTHHAHLIGFAGNQSCDGARLGTMQAALVTPRPNQQVWLGCANNT